MRNVGPSPAGDSPRSFTTLLNSSGAGDGESARATSARFGPIRRSACGIASSFDPSLDGAEELVRREDFAGRALALEDCRLKGGLCSGFDALDGDGGAGKGLFETSLGIRLPFDYAPSVLADPQRYSTYIPRVSP
jgi:hypothetical protein